LSFGNRFPASRTHLSTATTRLRRLYSGLPVARPHGAQFRDLLIEPAFLFFKAKNGCVDYLVRQFWNCHFVVHPQHSGTILFFC